MTIAGIDLGTTFSKVSISDSQGNPTMLATDIGEKAISSGIYFGEDGNIVIGAEAFNCYRARYFGGSSRLSSRDNCLGIKRVNPSLPIASLVWGREERPADGRLDRDRRTA